MGSLLVWIGHVRLHNPDVMIGESKMRSGELQFRHMACHTLVRRSRTRSSLLTTRLVSPPRMAGKALRVVRDRGRLQVAMRIMAGNAGDPLVAGIVASAVFQTVRLEPHVPNVADSGVQHIARGAMTGATQIIQVCRRKQRGIEDRGIVPVWSLRSSHLYGMFTARAMAVLACHSRMCLLHVQSTFKHIFTRVARKTFLYFLIRQ